MKESRGREANLERNYREMRDKISVTKDQVPNILKDIFELFVDSHHRKSLLSTRKLIDEAQKRLVRQAVLMCCAFCGPDGELESNKVTTKFLDLARVTGDSDYEAEGLIVCLKWYSGILVERPAKKDAETIKKMKGILEEFEKAAKDLLVRADTADANIVMAVFEQQQ